jgi:glycosyltransferase involved in cell wall biosynthesis
MSAIVNNEKPLVSFFLATYNRNSVVCETLHKLYEQTYRPIEIVVADNSSSDGTPEMIEKDFPDVKLIKLTRNHGAIAARNIACINTHGEYVVSIDDDSFPGLHCIERMVGRFEEDSNLGLIPFKVLNYETNIENYYDELNIKGDSFGVEQHYWSGCGGAYRRTIFEEHGLWDEWGREAPFEFSVSAKSLYLGYANKAFSDVYVFHHWSTIGEAAQYRLSSIADYTASRSMLMFQFKYFPIGFDLIQSIVGQIWVCSKDVIFNRRVLLVRSIISGLLRSFHLANQRLPLKKIDAKKLKLTFNFRGR